ncbi:MAG: DUF808 domain-containing protein [Cellulomonadaceae bacterium]|jgi:predicted DNA repair protein MutK|nr:DUF808 domain-containing protein [Cellulomonadaceae bacterium]
MSAGLLALLDDISVIAKLAASSIDDVGAAAGRATVKTVGVVVDDTAVTPQYLQGVTPEREIPIVRKIALGSIRNKLVFILPLALILSQWAPWVLPWILIVGGSFLCYEGAEKVWAKIRGHEEEIPAAELGSDAEKALVSGAVRTDLILSTEIMLVALADVTDQPFPMRLAILVVVALVLTVAVYGFVGLIVKMDDMGLALMERARTSGGKALGRGLVTAMPKLLAVIGVVGTLAMLWVGGHILIQNLNNVGFTWPWEHIEHLAHAVRDAIPGVGGVLGWLTETVICAVVGLIWGSVIVAAIDGLSKVTGRESHEPSHTHEAHEPSDNNESDVTQAEDRHTV